MAASRRLIGAAVVTYNSAGTIERCVRSLFIAGVSRVVVVDNQSSDTTVDVLRSIDDARLTVIQAGENLGFGRATNRAAREVQEPLIAIVNPDAEALEDTFEVLERVLDDGRWWAVGPALLDGNGRREYSARGFPTIVGALFNRRFLAMFPRARFASLTRFLMLDHDLSTSFECDWLSGAFVLARREVFDELGGFDESYFLYYEDVDLFRRARDRGYSCAFVGEAVARHVIGGSSRSIVTKAAAWRVKSFLTYYRRYLRKGLFSDIKCGAALVTGVALEVVSRLIPRRRGHSLEA